MKFTPIEKTAPLACCCSLRSKSMYYVEDERPGKIHESPTMSYWCFKTLSPAGPDNEAARPLLCQPGRPCFCHED